MLPQSYSEHWSLILTLAETTFLLGINLVMFPNWTTYSNRCWGFFKCLWKLITTICSLSQLLLANSSGQECIEGSWGFQHQLKWFCIVLAWDELWTDFGGKKKGGYTCLLLHPGFLCLSFPKTGPDNSPGVGGIACNQCIYINLHTVILVILKPVWKGCNLFRFKCIVLYKPNLGWF